jgi:polysaccharide biosynthesis protein PslH
MNILFVAPYAPNLIRVRPYNLVKHLSALGHQVTLMTLWVDDEERDELRELDGRYCEVHAVRIPRSRSMFNAVKALPTRQPLQSVYSWQPALARKILELAGNNSHRPHYDVVHVEHLRGARYGLHIKKHLSAQRNCPPVVWDSVDSISFLFRQAAGRSKSWFGRWLTRFELGRTERYEGWLLNQFDRVLVTSQADRQALLALTHARVKSDSHVTVLPNGVDLDYFDAVQGFTREEASLVVSGKMSYHANVTMAMHLVQKIMPIIWEHRPEVRLTIVGKDPSRDILSLRLNPSITVTGTVSDMRPYLKKATVAVVPIMYGAGIQNKVLEAMASSTPVVSTPQAVSATSAVLGQDVLVADNEQSFAREVLCLLDDPEKRQRVGQAGRRYVEAHHHWSTIAKRLVELYEQVITTRNKS